MVVHACDPNFWKMEDQEVISGYIQSLKSTDYTQGTITKK